jgi:alpha-beta hydrolase superfamily lysophospholipase
VVLGLLALALVLNLVAFRHAYALTHFVHEGRRTRTPPALTTAEKFMVLVAGPVVPRPRNVRTPTEYGLEYERRLFTAADGVVLEAWYVPAPAPRALVVMFHGHADCKQSLLPPARTLHDMGYATLLVDFRGSGGSQGDRTSVGFHEAADVSAAFAHASALAGGLPVVLHGNSMGAAAVLKAVSDGRLRPAAVILECPFDRFASTVRHRFDTFRIPDFPAADLLLFWGGVQQGFNPWRFNPARYAAAVESPTLLMNGDRDPWVSVSEARNIFDRLRGPKRLQVFAGLGHQSFISARHAEWTAVVGNFLAATAAAGPAAER